jgi:hypothetical protein
MTQSYYVRITYEKYPTFTEYVDAIQRHYRDQDIELMDGFIHSPTEYVLCVGHFVDQAPYKSRYDWVKVYYQSTRERREDYMATEDYVRVPQVPDPCAGEQGLGAAGP